MKKQGLILKNCLKVARTERGLTQTPVHINKYRQQNKVGKLRD